MKNNGLVEALISELSKQEAIDYRKDKYIATTAEGDNDNGDDIWEKEHNKMAKTFADRIKLRHKGNENKIEERIDDYNYILYKQRADKAPLYVKDYSTETENKDEAMLFPNEQEANEYKEDLELADKEKYIVGKKTESICKTNADIKLENIQIKQVTEGIEYISKGDYEKIPDDYKTTIAKTLQARQAVGDNIEELRKLYMNLGYDETDPMIVSNENGGTVLKPVKVQEDKLTETKYSDSTWYEYNIDGNTFNFLCRTYDNYNSWGHDVELKLDYSTLSTARCRYYNRTWESFEYQTCMLKAINIWIDSLSEGAIDTYKSQNDITRLKSDERQEILNNDKNYQLAQKLYKAVSEGEPKRAKTEDYAEQEEKPEMQTANDELVKNLAEIKKELDSYNANWWGKERTDLDLKYYVPTNDIIDNLLDYEVGIAKSVLDTYETPYEYYEYLVANGDAELESSGNTYNFGGKVQNGIQWHQYVVDDNYIVLVSFHIGGDTRGNYTDYAVLEFDYDNQFLEVLNDVSYNSGLMFTLNVDGLDYTILPLALSEALDVYCNDTDNNIYDIIGINDEEVTEEIREKVNNL